MEEKVSSYKVYDGNPYEFSLKSAGAEVLKFKDFSSYQGNWFAKIKFNGEEYWVGGSYGSCSGCDAFQAETGYEDRTREEWTKFFNDFGAPYVTDKLDVGKEIAKFKEQSEWDEEAKDIVKFLEEV